MFKKVLWVTDFTEAAQHAGRYALQCAACSQGTMYALTVVDPGDLPLVLDDVPDPFVNPDKLRDEYEERVMNRLRQEIMKLGDASISIQGFLRVGVPWREIVDAAEELDVQLIVMGASGKRNLKTILLGSTAENVVRHGHCPVLVVR